MSERFGKIEQVSIKKMFDHEERDFTPWLAENIDKLSEEIGMELEVEATEAAVGPYSADILAKDTGSDRYVIIENQFGKTNHDHLGKLITYAAVLDAAAVIWVASDFTEEHQKALDWLNEYTSRDISFYGVKVELWKIDESRPAIRFNIISHPADISREEAVAQAPMTETKKIQLEFWTMFRDRLIQTKALTKTQTPGAHHWFDIALGRSGIFLSDVLYPPENRMGVRLYLRNRIADTVLEQLNKEKEEIETEIGQKLQWNPYPANRDKVIALDLKIDLRKKEKWPEYIDWMVENTRKFMKAFIPRIKKLILPIRNEEEIEEK